MKETLSECYGLIRTEMIRPPSSFDIVRNRKVLNVDLNTPDAVANTRRDGLVDRELADVVVSQLGLEGSALFTPGTWDGPLPYCAIRERDGSYDNWMVRMLSMRNSA